MTPEERTKLDKLLNSIESCQFGLNGEHKDCTCFSNLKAYNSEKVLEAVAEERARDPWTPISEPPEEDADVIVLHDSGSVDRVRNFSLEMQKNLHVHWTRWMPFVEPGNA